MFILFGRWHVGRKAVAYRTDWCTVWGGTIRDDHGPTRSFLQAKAGPFDNACDISKDSRKFLWKWMGRFVVWMEQHTD